MSGKQYIIEPTKLDFSRPSADLEAIRKFNPQRFEMEQLTAIVFEDVTTFTCAGYKDVTHDEFWCRGHMPGLPLMPGVVMCEAAAQLSSYFTLKYDLLGGGVVGFGGLEEVRFRAPVIPGDRLVLAVKMEKVRRGRMIVARFEGYVRDTLVVSGVVKGVPLPVDLSTPPASES